MPHISEALFCDAHTALRRVDGRRQKNPVMSRQAMPAVETRYPLTSDSAFQHVIRRVLRPSQLHMRRCAWLFSHRGFGVERLLPGLSLNLGVSVGPGFNPSFQQRVIQFSQAVLIVPSHGDLNQHRASSRHVLSSASKLAPVIRTGSVNNWKVLECRNACLRVVAAALIAASWHSRVHVSQRDPTRLQAVQALTDLRDLKSGANVRYFLLQATCKDSSRR
jgi:hypothetical protein